MTRMSSEEPRTIWLYRTAVLVLLSVLGTIFMVDKFLPYPWKTEKAAVLSRISVLEGRMTDVRRDVLWIRESHERMEKGRGSKD